MVFLPWQEQIRIVIQNTLSILYELQINGLCLLKQGPPPSSLNGISRCLSFLYKKMMKTNIVCLGITNFVVEEFKHSVRGCQVITFSIPSIHFFWWILFKIFSFIVFKVCHGWLIQKVFRTNGYAHKKIFWVWKRAILCLGRMVKLATNF